MPLTVERRDRNSGFSLVEVLAALAIAAALSAALMLTFSNTRRNAAHIRELIDMMTLGDNLLARISAEKVQAAGINGQERGYVWGSKIEPAVYTVNIVQRSENIQPDQVTIADNAKKLEQFSQKETKADAVDNEPASKWVGYRITILLQAPSGRKHVMETFRIGQRTTDDK
jgi:prepilin-type N-terminal cleavage/methylation domain-containing protein